MTNITVTPRATEKAYGLSKSNIYVFDVPVSANKQQIASAISLQFGVEVTGIKTLVQTGKVVPFSRGKRVARGQTSRSDSKKAYVTLAEGQSIKVFDEAPVETEATEKEKK